MELEKLTDSIFKLNIPFEDGFTSIFLLESGGEYILMDAAASDDDSKNYIIPLMKELDIVPRYIICSHLHPDHFGGIGLLAKNYPQAEISVFKRTYTLEGRNIHYFSDGEILLGRYKIICLKGHTEDSVGILDLKSGILLTADALQLYGSGRYGTGLALPGEYVKTLEKVRSLKLSGLIASHEYEPLGSTAFGADEINKYLDTCREALELILRTVRENSGAAPGKIAELYNSQNPSLPTINGWTVENVINDFFTQKQSC